MRNKADRLQVSLLGVIVLMLAVITVLVTGGQAVLAWSPGAGENVVVDNGYSFSGKTTTGTERPMLTLTNANAVRLNGPPAGAIFFTIANTEMMRISNSGRVGIGVTNPAYKLHVDGSAYASSYMMAPVFYDSSSSTYYLDPANSEVSLVANGQVKIGTTAATTYKLDVATSTGPAIRGTRTVGGNYGYLGGLNYGVCGSSTDSTGVGGFTTNGTAIYGQAGLTGKAAVLDGDVQIRSGGNLDVAGTLTKGSGSFKIDHPQDPENKYLYHSFVESPDMKNVYDGTVVLDSNGEALVRLPAYFESLNRDFRYQLTCIGGFAPVYVASEIQNNSFKIAGGTPNMKVSWQVTGIRKDAYASAHPVVVEQEKPASEKGLYLHWKEWGQPEEKGIDTAGKP